MTEVFHRLGSKGMSPARALDGLFYEPDPPIHTPRITAVVDHQDGTAWLGAARRSAGRRISADITVVTVRDLAPGDAVLLTTYLSDGTHVRVCPAVRDCRTAAADSAELLDQVWGSLDTRYAVAAALVDPLAGVAAARLRHARAPPER